MKTLPFLAAGLALGLLASSSAIAAATSAKQLWSTPLGGDAKWHQLTALGTLLVGTDAALVAITPEDGKIAWRRDDIKKSNRNNAREIPGTPVLICNTFDGMMNSKVTFLAIDSLTGQNIWTTPQMLAQYHGTIPVPDKNLVIFVVNTMDQKDNGVYFMAHDLATGAQKWSAKFTKAGGIPLHMADNSGKFIPTMDLSGYHDPVVDGGEMYVGYLGIHCIDLTTGATKWGVEFPPGNKGLKRTYAPLRIDGDRIYGAGGGSVYAINRRDGSTIWKSDRISDFAGLFKARDNAIVSQLEIVGGKIFSRYGGNFSDGKTAQLREPLGIVVLDPADGKSLYHFDKAKEGITNMVITGGDTKTVVFADGAHIYGIDASAATPAETFKHPIEFKKKMGVGGVAKIGLGALGGVSGLVKGVASANKGLLDVPVAMNLVGNRAVVQGKQHLLAFDTASKSSEWSLFYAAPSEALANIAMFAVTAAAAVYGNAQAAASGSYASSSYNSGVNTIHSNLSSYNSYTEKLARRGQSKASQGYSYILTKLEKDIGVVGVNLATGETDREIALKEKEPDYTVDEPMNRVFHFKGKSTVVGYQF